MFELTINSLKKIVYPYSFTGNLLAGIAQW
jgi:hypothetical protein